MNINEKKIAYFGISKSNRILFDLEIGVVRKCLEENGFLLEIFVDKYDFAPDDEKEMMRIALEEINNCDILIAELSRKAIGVGVEVGYAKAMNKPIVYIKRKEAKYSTTVGGVSDFFIEYGNKNQLENKLKEVMDFINGCE